MPRRNLRRALLLIIAIVAVIAIKRSGGLSLDRIFQQVAPAAPTPHDRARAASTTTSKFTRRRRTTCRKNEMTAPGEPMAWVIFGVVVAAMLALDLGVFHRKAHAVRGREAAIWSVVWISVALLFNLGIYLRSGSDRGLEFFQAWLIEKALSVDNLFVFLAAFSFFAVPENLQHRVLFWGILGALITRGVFIAVGAVLLAAFHWVTYIFGVFLVVTAIRLLFGGDEEVRPEKNPVLLLFRRFVRSTPDYDGPHFFVRQGGKLFATPLLTVLVVIEATDVVFAVDSIPAVFGVTRDVFIVYTSNIFAVLGLRALTLPGGASGPAAAVPEGGSGAGAGLRRREDADRRSLPDLRPGVAARRRPGSSPSRACCRCSCRPGAGAPPQDGPESPSRTKPSSPLREPAVRQDGQRASRT